MLNPFVWLLLLCIAMLISSFVAGCIPLASKLSETKLNFLTCLSVGLLISTSLVVIIPEGIETLYSSREQDRNHNIVGLAILFGFAIMFVIDQISSLHIHSPPEHAKNKDTIDIMDTESSVLMDNKMTHSVSTPTIGLIVHAAADGIALGASATHPQLSMVVFLAIMLHKAPSAFALTTVLLNKGLSRTKIRQCLLMFSMAAPIGAISTFWFSFHIQNLEYWTSILLLFSGGTFLYVAMHALQESPNQQTSFILLGMFIPILLNLNHSH